jgi:hypothetical protein
VTSLLPHTLWDGVAHKTVSLASQSFGVVTLTLLVALLLEREALRVARASPSRLIGLSVCAGPLLVVVTLTIAARISLLVH